MPHIYTGELFRANLKGLTELGLAAQRFMNAGELVSDQVTVGMGAQRHRQPDAGSGLVLDRFPRTVTEAEALSDLLACDDKGWTRWWRWRCRRVWWWTGCWNAAGAMTPRNDPPPAGSLSAETGPPLRHYQSRMVSADAVDEVEKITESVLHALHTRTRCEM